MLEFIPLIIFLISVLVIGLILARKIPALNELPKNGHHGLKKHPAIVNVEKKLANWYFDFFEKQILLQKLLSKFRVFTLKVERKVDELLHGIRKKAQELDKQGKKKR